MYLIFILFEQIFSFFFLSIIKKMANQMEVGFSLGNRPENTPADTTHVTIISEVPYFERVFSIFNFIRIGLTGGVVSVRCILS